MLHGFGINRKRDLVRILFENILHELLKVFCELFKKCLVAFSLLKIEDGESDFFLRGIIT